MADVRLLLTDKEIARLPTPRKGWYLARDTELKGFFVVEAETNLYRPRRPERLPRNILLR
ncbi:hypothetical protein [Bradyrhizobium sp. SZCCHNRI3043]|uniref:hypothetical protein n=1 Tax=Bradyrhizobium sp. SZCCHNRI3043 TaxID=3057292 RepID=UPI0028E42A46|nr:hypothetical protein [Bradyrhizobium sp. SZCCHNRI3043]